jgi:hypothetical protein
MSEYVKTLEADVARLLPDKPGPGHNSGTLDLSLALDADQLLADLRADTAALAARTDDLVAAFGRFQARTADGIADDVVLAQAGDFVRQLRAHIAAVDSRRTVVKAPVLAAQRAIDGFFKAALAEPVEHAIKGVTHAVDDYMRRLRAIEAERAREEAARQRAEADRMAREAEQRRSASLMDAAVEAEAKAEALEAAPVAVEPVRSDLGTTISTRHGLWKVRVTDITLVPAQYLVINEAVLIATARTNPAIAAGQQPVPGVEFYREIKSSIR